MSVGALASVLAVAGWGGSSLATASTEPPVSESQGTDEGGLAEARAAYERLYERPTQIPVDVPIELPIPSGRSLAYVSCGAQSCIQAGQTVEKVAADLGWDYKFYSTDGTPEGFRAALDQVVADQPNHLMYAGIDQAVIQSHLEELEKLGTFVTAQCVLDPVSELIDYVVCDAEATVSAGVAVAAWVVNAADGEANTLYVNLPDFRIFEPMQEGFVDFYERTCIDCALDILDISLADLGSGEAQNKIVSYLRSHPDTDYVALAYDGLSVGLPAALDAAGLADRVTYAGQSPDTSTLPNVATGAQGATVTEGVNEMIYMQVDAHIRAALDLPQVPVGEIPRWIVDQDNIPATDYVFPSIEDYDAQFRALWGIE